MIILLKWHRCGLQNINWPFTLYRLAGTDPKPRRATCVVRSWQLLLSHAIFSLIVSTFHCQNLRRISLHNWTSSLKAVDVETSQYVKLTFLWLIVAFSYRWFRARVLRPSYFVENMDIVCSELLMRLLDQCSKCRVARSHLPTRRETCWFICIWLLASSNYVLQFSWMFVRMNVIFRVNMLWAVATDAEIVKQ